MCSTIQYSKRWLLCTPGREWKPALQLLRAVSSRFRLELLSYGSNRGALILPTDNGLVVARFIKDLQLLLSHANERGALSLASHMQHVIRLGRSMLQVRAPELRQQKRCTNFSNRHPTCNQSFRYGFPCFESFDSVELLSHNTPAMSCRVALVDETPSICMSSACSLRSGFWDLVLPLVERRCKIKFVGSCIRFAI